MSKSAQHLIARPQHGVSRTKISDNALKVLYRLHKSGYEAFLVGGGVRDILLGLQPKDFDISTNATPEQIKKLFRNCRIIGRRFRLAHIIYGRDVIEVATFRAHCDDNIQQAQDGMILRDNVYGTLEEDAIRRDFTVNALYYNIADFSVHDYCGGLEDLAKRQLRIIGDPETRYREDPVRMLRAVRLSSKLNLSIETNSKQPITEMASLLESIPAARLWEEYKKMFLAGQAYHTFHQLRKLSLLAPLFPATHSAIEKDDDFLQLVNIALTNTDKRIKSDQSINPAFLLAVMLWQPLLLQTQTLLSPAPNGKASSYNDAFFKGMGLVINQQSQHVSIMRRHALVIQDVWALQIRLQSNYGKRVWKTFEHPRFRAGYDFLLLRSKVDPELKPLATWWTDFQEANPEQKRQLILKASNASPKRGSRSGNKRRKPRKRANNNSQPPKNH